jgi:hypothetical protein
MNHSTGNLQSISSRPLLIIISLLAALVMTGCAPKRHDAYYHEHDHHRVIYYEYDYYPTLDIYFDFHSHHYIYHHHNRGWVRVKKLPGYIRIHGHKHHRLKFRDNRPWHQEHQYKHHRSYTDNGVYHERHNQRAPDNRDRNHSMRNEPRHKDARR